MVLVANVVHNNKYNHTFISNNNHISFSRGIRTQRGFSKTFKAAKLAPNMLPKKKYVVHLRNLQYYLSLGAVITKIHRIISFYQEAWIAPYIQQNTLLRQQALDDFEKSYYKLLNNAFFGG